MKAFEIVSDAGDVIAHAFDAGPLGLIVLWSDAGAQGRTYCELAELKREYLRESDKVREMDGEVPPSIMRLLSKALSNDVRLIMAVANDAGILLDVSSAA